MTVAKREKGRWGNVVDDEDDLLSCPCEQPDDDGNDVDDGNGEEENCGRAATTSSRIIGGGIAEPDEYPWTVALRLGNG